MTGATFAEDGRSPREAAGRTTFRRNTDEVRARGARVAHYRRVLDELLDAFTLSHWANRAACVDVDDPAIFFPERGESAAPAKAICARCPARAECLDDALASDTKVGIWGGLTERERRGLRPGDPAPPVKLRGVPQQPSAASRRRAVQRGAGVEPDPFDVWLADCADVDQLINRQIDLEGEAERKGADRARIEQLVERIDRRLWELYDLADAV